MALTPSGSISLGDINTALGRSSTASIDMNDVDVRFISNNLTSTSIIDMNSLRDKYYFSGTLTYGVNDVPGVRLIRGYSTTYSVGAITGNLFGSTISNMYTDALSPAATYVTTSSANIVNRSYRIKMVNNNQVDLAYISTTSLYGDGSMFNTTTPSIGQTISWQFAG